MLKRVLAHYAGGLCAGTLIAIGGGVFLGCRSMGNVGQVAGAVFFTVALLCICLQGYALYTGRIGFIPEKHDTEALSALFLGLAGNLSATMLWGLAVRYAIPSTAEAADAVAAAKLTQSFPQTLLRATLCGVLMYLAVTVWRDRSSFLPDLSIPSRISSTFPRRRSFPGRCGCSHLPPCSATRSEPCFCPCWHL